MMLIMEIGKSIHSSTTNSKHLFTIDNAPPSKWHDEIFNMYSVLCVEDQAILQKIVQNGEVETRFLV